MKILMNFHDDHFPKMTGCRGLTLSLGKGETESSPIPILVWSIWRFQDIEPQFLLPLSIYHAGGG